VRWLGDKRIKAQTYNGNSAEIGMKTSHTWILSILALCFSGCATQLPNVVTTPVGPSPSALERLTDKGTLVVYSALDLDDGNSDVDLRPHSSYKVFGPDQKLLQKVYNRAGTHIPDPVVISLLPGNYSVEARAAGIGYLQVPVVIEKGHRTVVHLDGSELSTVNKVSPTEVVTLPDGLIIGWKVQPPKPAQ
jgi:hypothetical protein